MTLMLFSCCCSCCCKHLLLVRNPPDGGDDDDDKVKTQDKQNFVCYSYISCGLMFAAPRDLYLYLKLVLYSYYLLFLLSVISGSLFFVTDCNIHRRHYHYSVIII